MNAPSFFTTKMAGRFPLVTFFIPFLLISIILSSSSAAAAGSVVRDACKASRNPSACEASLSKSSPIPPNAPVSQVIESALSLASSNLNKVLGMVVDFKKASPGNANLSQASDSCFEVLNYGVYRMNLTADAVKRSRMKDARSWLSAAFSNQYDCWSGLRKVNDSSQVVNTMAFLDSASMFSTTNVLGMIVNYDIFGDKTASWGVPKTEREGYWEPAQDSSKSGDSIIGVPKGLKPDVTVCKNGCKYKMIQAAVDTAPDFLPSGKRFVIEIKAGIYTEMVRIPLEKRNIVFLGDGMGKTVITGSLSVGVQGISTFKTATVGVIGDGFMATGVTFQNTAGNVGQQAVAFRSDSDLSILENCEFLGNQDTLYAHSLRQYYKSCRIVGNIDFIFGNSAAFFEQCQIIIAPRTVDPQKGEDNVVAAHGRTDPSQTTGLFFHNCDITGTVEYLKIYKSNPQVHKNYLGRPWKEFSRTIFINCTVGELISPDGWMPWDKDFGFKTVYFGESGSLGLGANPLKRVPWSTQIPPQHIKSYSIGNFINRGDAISAAAPLPTIQPPAIPPVAPPRVIQPPAIPPVAPPRVIQPPAIPPSTDDEVTPPPTDDVDDVVPPPADDDVPSPVVPSPPRGSSNATSSRAPLPARSPPVKPISAPKSAPGPTTPLAPTSPKPAPGRAASPKSALPPVALSPTTPNSTLAPVGLPRTTPKSGPAPAPNASSPTTQTNATTLAPTPKSSLAAPTPSSPTTPKSGPAPAPNASSPTTQTNATTLAPTPKSSPAAPTPSSPTTPKSSPAAPTPTSAPVPTGSSPTTPTSAPVPTGSSPATSPSASASAPGGSSHVAPTSGPVSQDSVSATPSSAPTPSADIPSPATPPPPPPAPAPASQSYAHALQRPDRIFFLVFCVQLLFII